MNQVDQLQAQLETTQLLLQEWKKDSREKDRQISILKGQINDDIEANVIKVIIEKGRRLEQELVKIHALLDHILETLNKTERV